ncbi:MAG: alanine racemase [Nitrospiraceae bacterium]|nr:alanine racemase [Nitrospiraceae bacterium]
MDRGPEAVIDLAALRHNLNALSKAAGKPVIAVVKADAYGHGAIEVARVLEKEKGKIFALAVAFLSEAKHLREAGIKLPILVLFDNEAPEEFIKYGLTPVLQSVKAARAFSKKALSMGVELRAHVKIDTGMGRMGIPWAGATQALSEIIPLPGIKMEGLMSHISESAPGAIDFARFQIGRFRQLKKDLAAKGIKPLCHIAGSASALILPEARMDAVRVGLLMYGGRPYVSAGGVFKPVMKVKSRLILAKKMKKGEAVSYDRTFIAARNSVIGVAAVGYADGYPRALSNRAHMLVKGQRAPVCGRVCMDLTVLDITGLSGAAEGAEAVLLGGGLTASELAEWAGTNPYEIMTSLGRGARRSYVV